MKTGIIVYLRGEREKLNEIEPEELIKDLKIEADKIELVESGSSNFDVMDAWWKLTAKGMNRIICLMAELTKNSSIRLTGHELRLFG